MTNLNTIQLNSNSGHHFKAVQFTSASKEQMLAINKYLGVQAFQSKYIDDILDSFKDGDELIPIFYKNGGVGCIELKDWIYVRGGEIYTSSDFSNLINGLTEISESEVNNGKD